MSESNIKSAPCASFIDRVLELKDFELFASCKEMRDPKTALEYLSRNNLLFGLANIGMTLTPFEEHLIGNIIKPNIRIHKAAAEFVWECILRGERWVDAFPFAEAIDFFGLERDDVTSHDNYLFRKIISHDFILFTRNTNRHSYPKQYTISMEDNMRRIFESKILTPLDYRRVDNFELSMGFNYEHPLFSTTSIICDMQSAGFFDCDGGIILFYLKRRDSRISCFTAYLCGIIKSYNSFTYYSMLHHDVFKKYISNIHQYLAQTGGFYLLEKMEDRGEVARGMCALLKRNL